MRALCLRRCLNKFGTDLTVEVNLDASTGVVHRDLEQFLIVRGYRPGGNGAITRRRASHRAAALGTRPRRICTTVFSMSDPQIGIVGLIFDTLDGLDGVVNVGKVDKRAILFLEKIDQFDITVLAKIALQSIV